MAITTTVSNHFKYQVGAKKVDLLNDTFKGVLTSGEYSFDKDADATYLDIISGELPGGGGYTVGGHPLTLSSYIEDDVNDRASLTFQDITITGTGTNGFSGEVGSMIIYDDDTTDDTVVGIINFGQTHSIYGGQKLKINDIKLNFS